LPLSVLERTSGDTRAFVALMAIAQHHGRPHTPSDQAWVESFLHDGIGDVFEVGPLALDVTEAIGYVTQAEIARLGEALKEMAVKVTLLEGKERWG
jgi:hypothetical protein